MRIGPSHAASKHHETRGGSCNPKRNDEKKTTPAQTKMIDARSTQHQSDDGEEAVRFGSARASRYWRNSVAGSIPVEPWKEDWRLHAKTRDR